MTRERTTKVQVLRRTVSTPNRGGTSALAGQAWDHATVSRWQSDLEPFPGCGFTRADDVWNLHFRATVAERPGFSTLNFTLVPEWFRPAAKDFIAYGLIVRRYTNMHLRQQVYSLRDFTQFLSQYHPHIQSVLQFDDSLARAVELWVKNHYKNDAKTTKARIMMHLSVFAKWLRNEQGAERFYIRPMGFNFMERKPFQKAGQCREIPLEIRMAVTQALAVEEAELHAKIKQTGRNGDRVAMIYCQVLRMLTWTGRRISHILFMKRNPLSEPLPGMPAGVRVWYNETKLDTGEQDVFVPAPADLFVRDAVATAQEMVDAMAPGQDKPFLFMTNFRRRYRTGELGPILSTPFRHWLNGYKGKRGKYRPGFVHRHNIKYNGEFFKLMPHDYRRTRATLLRKGGASRADAKQDLKHVDESMTDTYLYASEQYRQEVKALYDSDALIGEGAGVFPPSDEARIALPKWFDHEQVELHLRNNRRVQKTIYGGCLLPMDTEPCPVPDSGLTGCDGNDGRERSYIPDDYEAVQADIEFERQQLAQAEKLMPRSPYLQHLRNRIALAEKTLARLAEMQVKRGDESGE